MNKNVMYFILLVQGIISSFCSSDNYIVGYNNVKNEHTVHLEEAIKTIFPVQSFAINVNPLLGGLSGDSLYIVEAHSYKYVFRCMKQPHSVAICQKECMYAEKAAQKDLGPKILYQNSQAGCYLTEFVEGMHLSSSYLEDRFVLEHLADNLNTLHTLSIDSQMGFDIFERLEQKVESSMQKNPVLSVQLRHCLSDLKRIKMAVANHAIELKTCHNDIHSLNVFYTPENTIQFIDWGNAGLGDPFWDLACSSIKLHFSSEQRHSFLEKYFHTEVSSVDRAHFTLMEQAVLWEVWLYYLDMRQNIAPQSAKDAVCNYFRKIKEEIRGAINTFDDLASICFDLIQKRDQSEEYQQALRLLEQL